MKSAIILAIGLGVLSGRASAQDVEALRMVLAKNEVAPSDSKSIAFFHRFGTCLASRANTDALSRLPRSTKSNNELINLALSNTGCASWQDSVKFSPHLLRGIIAEEYLRELRAGKKMNKAVLKVYVQPTSAEGTRLDSSVKIDVALVDIGSCVDRSDRVGVSNIFVTQAGSAEETRAFSAILHALSDCVPPGIKMNFSKFELRGFLAEGAYRNAAQSVSVGN